MATAPARIEDQLTRARDVAGDLRERAEDLEPVVRERLEDLEPAARQARIGVWRALHALFTGLAILPGVLVRVLRVLAGTADELAERGRDVSEQVRSVRSGARVRRGTLIASVGAGFGVGLGLGWVLGRRAAVDHDVEAELEAGTEHASTNGPAQRSAALVE